MLGKYISQELDKGIMPQSACLPCEDIAAFADDRMDKTNRERVILHLGNCRDCYALYADTLATRALVTGRADAPTSDRRVAKVLMYAIPTALAACLALIIFSGVFKVGTPGTGGPTEMKMPATTTLPVDEIKKKADEFRNMSGHEGKK
jgi:hypothetical protein